eukprot:2394981-Pyramimonas_sp.AAC.1
MCQEVHDEVGISSLAPFEALEEGKDILRAGAQKVKRELDRAGATSTPEFISRALVAMRIVDQLPHDRTQVDPPVRALRACPKLKEFIDGDSLLWLDLA